MPEKQNEISVYGSNRFEKALSKLPETQLKIVKNLIDKIIEKPETGEVKKGDLSYLRVHKFRMDNQQVLLGYFWIEDKLEIYLLHIGPHENCYQKVKGKRKVDLKVINP